MSNKLPAQVQKMAEKAEALIAEAEASKSQEPQSVDKAETGAPATNPGPENQVQAQTNTATESPKKEENWEEKYKLLQGKYNAEIQVAKDNKELVPSLKAQIKDLTQRIRSGESYVKKLEEEVRQAKSQPPAQAKVEMPESVLSLLSEDDRAHFEEEGIDNKSIEIIGKLIKNFTLNANPKPTADLDEIKREVAEIRQEAKSKKVKSFFEELDSAVPDWAEVNDSEEFKEWLVGTVKYTNITRNEAIQRAQDNNDHRTAIEMFNDFKSTRKKAAKEEPKPALNLEKHLEPSSSVGGEVPQKPAGKTYTRAEVKQFYNDRALNRLKNMSDKEIEALDRDIIKADREGRITN